MAGDATLGGLGATYRRAIRQLEDAQSSGNVTIDRCGEAVRQIGLAADGSSSELVSSALAGIASATLSIEQAIAQLIAAKTDIEQFLADRGI